MAGFIYKRRTPNTDPKTRNRLMKSLSLVAALLITFTFVGCGGSSEPTNIMEGTTEEAMQSYEEMIAADEAMMSDADAADEIAEEPAATE